VISGKCPGLLLQLSFGENSWTIPVHEVIYSKSSDQAFPFFFLAGYMLNAMTRPCSLNHKTNITNIQVFHIKRFQCPSTSIIECGKFIPQKAKPVSLEESFRLLQDQEKRYKVGKHLFLVEVPLSEARAKCLSNVLFFLVGSASSACNTEVKRTRLLC